MLKNKTKIHRPEEKCIKHESNYSLNCKNYKISRLVNKSEGNTKKFHSFYSIFILYMVFDKIYLIEK